MWPSNNKNTKDLWHFDDENDMCMGSTSYEEDVDG